MHLCSPNVGYKIKKKKSKLKEGFGWEMGSHGPELLSSGSKGAANSAGAAASAPLPLTQLGWFWFGFCWVLVLPLFCY